MLKRALFAVSVLAVTNAGVLDSIQNSYGSSYSEISHHAPSVQLSHSLPSLHHFAPASLELHSIPSIPVHLGHVSHEEPFDHHPKYSYKYGVSDKHHGDYKSAEEQRDGDVVRGSYTLLQPDGVSRTVKYTVDKKSGFNAVVEYKGKARHPAPSHHDSGHIAVPVHHVQASVPVVPINVYSSLSHRHY